MAILKKVQWSSIEVLAGVFVLVIVSAGVVAFLIVDVCDQQLAPTGQVLSVCRHLQASDPPILALGLLVLPALGVFFSEVSGFGISLKREVKVAKEAAQAAREVAETVRADNSDLAEGVGQALTRSRPQARMRLAAGEGDAIAELADRYNTIRWTMPSGPERTMAMSSVVSQMVEVLREAGSPQVSAHLQSDDRGFRLAGYASLYGDPDPDKAPELIAALLSEDKPFGQYWALKALLRTMDTHPVGLDGQTRRSLAGLLDEVGRGSDRGHLLQDILDRSDR